MDIKDLNKPQMILLVLLVSFVVSIGTGVSVVSLMQPEPTTVTQTINKVIQHTIESVEKVTVQEDSSGKKENKNDTKDSAPTSTVTSIKPLVDLYSLPKENPDIIPATSSERRKIGQAVIISDTGIVLVDGSIVNSETSYQVVLDQNYFNLDIVSKVGSMYVFQVVSKADPYVGQNVS